MAQGLMGGGAQIGQAPPEMVERAYKGPAASPGTPLASMLTEALAVVQSCHGFMQDIEAKLEGPVPQTGTAQETVGNAPQAVLFTAAELMESVSVLQKRLACMKEKL